KAEAVKRTAAWGWIATRHEFTQHATTIQIQHLQRFPAPPDSSNKSDFVAIIKYRRIEFDKGAVSHAGRIRPAQRNIFEALVGSKKNPLSGARSGNAGAKCDLARIVQRRKRMPREFGQDAASRHRIADRRRFRNPRDRREENAFR